MKENKMTMRPLILLNGKEIDFSLELEKSYFLLNGKIRDIPIVLQVKSKEIVIFFDKSFENDTDETCVLSFFKNNIDDNFLMTEDHGNIIIKDLFNNINKNIDIEDLFYEIELENDKFTKPALKLIYDLINLEKFKKIGGIYKVGSNTPETFFYYHLYLLDTIPVIKFKKDLSQSKPYSVEYNNFASFEIISKFLNFNSHQTWFECVQKEDKMDLDVSFLSGRCTSRERDASVNQDAASAEVMMTVSDVSSKTSSESCSVNESVRNESSETYFNSFRSIETQTDSLCQKLDTVSNDSNPIKKSDFGIQTDIMTQTESKEKMDQKKVQLTSTREIDVEKNIKSNEKRSLKGIICSTIVLLSVVIIIIFLIIFFINKSKAN